MRTIKCGLGKNGNNLTDRCVFGLNKEAYIENMSLVDLLQNFKLHLPGVFKEVRTQRRTRQKICTDILVNCTDILVIHTDTFFCPKKMVISGSDMPSANHDVVLLTAVVLTRIQT